MRLRRLGDGQLRRALAVASRNVPPGDPPADMLITLVRHGQPDIQRRRWISRRAFASFIDAYERAGLAAHSKPPKDVVAAAEGLTHVFCSDRPRSLDSARAIAPHASLLSDPLFMEAQLKSPFVPIVRMPASGWGTLARLAWHAGDTKGIETWADCKRRALRARDRLIGAAETDGRAMLVAHGYINLMIGIRLLQKGWRRHGKHKVEYWNMVTYAAP